MLRDSKLTNSTPPTNSLSVSPSIEVKRVLEFIDQNISEFCTFYKSIKDSDRENRISDFLVHHLQICKLEKDRGFFPFDFRKNPTQAHSGKETDIGVFVLTRGSKPVTIIEFEAKRFSESSNNKEYVCGEKGGIERFKRGHHSSHLSICGMFGYVQSRTCQEWIDKVNGWISDLAANNLDLTIDWTAKEEQLVVNNSLTNVEKLLSQNLRIETSDKIHLWHYIIFLS